MVEFAGQSSKKSLSRSSCGGKTHGRRIMSDNDAAGLRVHEEAERLRKRAQELRKFVRRGGGIDTNHSEVRSCDGNGEHSDWDDSDSEGYMGEDYARAYCSICRVWHPRRDRIRARLKQRLLRKADEAEAKATALLARCAG